MTSFPAVPSSSGRPSPGWLALLLTVAIQVGSLVWAAGRWQESASQQQQTQQQLVQSLNRLNDVVYDLRERVSVIEDREHRRAVP